MLHTHLTSNWGLAYPVVGAPMSGNAWGALARAITSGGGLGMIGMGDRAEVATIERESALARGDDESRFGIGLMIWALPARPELLDAALAARPFLLSLSFGDPAPYVERVHRAGIRLATQVNTRDAAKRALDAGVDCIVAQGTEAGGHTGHVATLPILQIVLEEVDRRGQIGRTCVLAAGGIATPRGVAAVLAAGADGAWIGTPFLLAEEARIAAGARERVRGARETDTMLTRAFDVARRSAWPPEHPGRALRNAFAARWTGREPELLYQPDVVAAYEAAVAHDDFALAQVYAGQSVGLIDRVRPAAEIVRELGEGAERVLRHASRHLLGGA